jgi:hypothetical protein
MDHYGRLIPEKAERPGRILVEDLGNITYLNEVVPAADGTELVLSPLVRLLGNRIGVGIIEAPLILDIFQVRTRPETMSRGPPRPFLQYSLQFAMGELKVFAP